MKYYPPFGSIDPDASYVDKNVPGAVRGSAVPAKAIEIPQRELVDFITKSGMVPSEVLQLALAVQSGIVNYAAAGGTANALTASLSPQPAGLPTGFPIHLKIASVNTGAMTLVLNGGLVKDIRGEDGAALPAGSVFPNQIATLVYNGTNWVLTGFSASLAPPRSLSIFDSGSGNFVVPANVYRIFVQLWGGGGGGGGSSTSTGGSGGGAGGYAEGWFNVTPGQSLAYVVGAGGNGGGPGQTGGSSSIGGLLSAVGGGGGSDGFGTPGSGGAGTGGSLQASGGSGGRGYVIGSTAVGGFGAPAYQGTVIPGGITIGTQAYGPGGGGAGGANVNVGGAGRSGRIIIQY